MLTETQLLNHIYQTAEMGGDGIQQVLSCTGDPKLLQTLTDQLGEYQKLRARAGELLQERGAQAKGLSPMAKASAGVMSTMKTLTDHSATKVAEMMIQGSTMGVTKSIRCMRDCQMEDTQVRELADRLLKTEEANIQELKQFL